MSKILVTPVASSGIEPFEVEGNLTITEYVDTDGSNPTPYYYIINGSSYPAEIVTVLED